MLAKIYVNALLVDENLADEVWELWNVGMIPDGLATIAWCIVASKEGQLWSRAWQ